MVKSIPPFVYLFIIGILVLGLIAFAIYFKGDVKAAVKMLGVEFSIDVKDKPPAPKTLTTKN
jgi:hypothetical protein